MVDAAVQKRAVVRHEQETALPLQIAADDGAPLRIEVVRWFIQKREGVVAQKQRSEQKLRLFTAAQRPERLR